MNALRLAPLAAVLAAAPLAAQSITSVEPTRFVQVDPGVIGSQRTLAIRGTGLTPGANVGEAQARVRWEMRRSGGEWQRPPNLGGGVTHDEWDERFYSKDWLGTPGTLEVRMVVDGRPTNTMTVQVVPAPASPPRITLVSPATLRPGTEAQTFSMHVADLSEPFTVSIGGAETTQFGRYDVDAGDLLWYFPRALIGRPGRYPVVVSTRAGASYPAYVDVLGVPRVVSVTPAEIVREKAGDGTTVRIRVVFDGSMPATARVGSDRLGWVTRSSLQLADSATAVWVDVPMEMVQKVTVGAPEQVSVVLTNEAGASTGTFAVRSDGSTLRVARPGISTPATRAIVRPPPPSHPPMVRP